MPKAEETCPVIRRQRQGNQLIALVLMVVACLVASTLFAVEPARAELPQLVMSRDGTPISYEVHGAGEPTLVFVHGWSCDARYWRAQLAHFSKRNRVVLLDLAGHGHSGMSRTKYGMKAFGEDVQAVAEAVGSRSVILIGHSMGGPVIAEAARLMPKRVVGLVGVDTFENIEYPMTANELEQMVAPLEKDFRTGTRDFVQTMILPRTDPLLREWILADMSAAPPAVALSAFKEMMTQYITGEAARIFDDIKAPVVVVKGDLWPLEHEANRRHMLLRDVIVLKDSDHFLMLDRADDFNRALGKAIAMLRRE